jgi:hypothetical protein
MKKMYGRAASKISKKCKSCPEATVKNPTRGGQRI